MDTLLDYLAPAGAGFLLVLPFLVDRYLRKAQETAARRKKQA